VGGCVSIVVCMCARSNVAMVDLFLAYDPEFLIPSKGRINTGKIILFIVNRFQTAAKPIQIN